MSNKQTSGELDVSVVILTYKRKELILSLLGEIYSLRGELKEIIVIDNNSGEGLSASIADQYPGITCIALDENLGTLGRNIGVQKATSDIVILLDDDIYGLTQSHIKTIKEHFSTSEKIAALCFKVIHSDSKRIINWCHHKPSADYSDTMFETNEITEGAVAFYREKFISSGGFAGQFFISHEGPDLALRLMDSGYEVWYLPSVSVNHHQSTLGRPSWRRYYYDTRNVIWLAIRNYPIFYSFRFLFVQLGAMFIYSIRDGYLRYFLKAVYDAIKHFGVEYGNRNVLKKETMRRLRVIYKDDESLFRKAYSRLFKRGVDC